MRPVALIARREAIKQLQGEPFDLLVIGGGITGTGIAQDAASRGLKVALIERGDYAIGTSSRSSKLIHGGLRYLAQGDFRVTYESCAERALLQQLAPHIVRARTFLVPVYRWGYLLQLVTGLWIYDIISQLKNSRFHRRLSIKKSLELAPQLERRDLICGYLYHDCQTNDARLVMEVAKSAASYGAVSANYLEVTGVIKAAHRIIGVHARDHISGNDIEVRAHIIVNATGVWMDTVRRFDEPQSERKVRPAKGTHILIPRSRVPTDTALLFESAARDGRSLFFIPWYEGTIIGTTDTDFQGEIDSPRASQEDIDYIISSAARIFPDAKLTHDDILSSYAGLRPLIDEGNKSTKDISREHRTFESDSGLISIAGGKLTTYRRMAQGAVDLVFDRLIERGTKAGLARSKTDKIYLSGLEPGQTLASLQEEAVRLGERAGIEREIAMHLAEDYGNNARDVITLVSERPALAERLLPHLPFIKAEVVYATRAEQAARLEDFLVRRSRIALLTKDQGQSCTEQIARLMAVELGWSEAEIEREIARYQQTSARQYSPVY